jgi:hypothetical protein
MNSKTLVMHLPGTDKTCKNPYLLVNAVMFKSDDARGTLGLSLKTASSRCAEWGCASAFARYRPGGLYLSDA